MITLSPDHVARAIAKLPAQHRKENIEAVLSAVVSQIQDVENVTYDVYLAKLLDSATDAALDQIGAVVGQPRDGNVDVDYRRLIRARISVRRSQGQISDIIKVSRLAINDSSVNIRPLQSGIRALRVILSGTEVDSTTLAQLFDLLGETKSAGIRLLLEYNDEADEESFLFGPVTNLSSFDFPAVDSGDTEIAVTDATGFPTSGGIIRIGKGTANEEDWTYTSHDGTTFYGSVGVANDHDTFEDVILLDTDIGLADTPPTEGGYLIGVLS